MNFNELNIYIAAPFFNEKQLNFVKEIESVLERFDIKYFSPRKEGVISEQKGLGLETIYKSNINHLNECNFMIAVIDDFDTGTIWEMGYFTNIKDNMMLYKRFITTITEKDHGLNVMLKFGTDCHVKSIHSLYFMMQELSSSKDIFTHTLGKFDREQRITT